jgi:hypothetical protein
MYNNIANKLKPRFLGKRQFLPRFQVQVTKWGFLPLGFSLTFGYRLPNGVLHWGPLCVTYINVIACSGEEFDVLW